MLSYHLVLPVHCLSSATGGSGGSSDRSPRLTTYVDNVSFSAQPELAGVLFGQIAPCHVSPISFNRRLDGVVHGGLIQKHRYGLSSRYDETISIAISPVHFHPNTQHRHDATVLSQDCFGHIALTQRNVLISRFIFIPKETQPSRLSKLFRPRKRKLCN